MSDKAQELQETAKLLQQAKANRETWVDATQPNHETRVNHAQQMVKRYDRLIREIEILYEVIQTGDWGHAYSELAKLDAEE